MPLLILGLAGLIAVVALLRFSNISFGPKLPRYLGMALTGAAAVFFAVIERWVPAVFFASICWTVYTGGRALPRDWTDPVDIAEDDPPPRRGRQAMSRDEALKVLGLGPDAQDDDIRAAHRRLILQIHPDKGGSDYLASKINEAKDVLLD
jgi:hypothetical protein